MKIQPRYHISNNYYTCTVVTSPVNIESKALCTLNIQKDTSEQTLDPV